MSAPGCAMQTCITDAPPIKFDLRAILPLRQVAPRPATFLSLHRDASLFARRTESTSRHSMYRILPTQPHAILPTGLSAEVDLRDIRVPLYQAPPHSHNRRSCRSRSRTRKSLRGRFNYRLRKIRGHARVLQSRIVQVRSPGEFLGIFPSNITRRWGKMVVIMKLYANIR